MTEEFKIDREDDIVTVRQRVKTLASENGFDSFATAAITTAASELSRNVWTHGHGGIVQITILKGEAGRLGLKLHFVDHGPGIADLKKVMAGGFSTVRSLGLGLSGSKRLVDDFHIDTQPGRGTEVTVTKWKRLF